MIAEHWQALSDSKAAAACSVVPERLEQLRKIVADVTGQRLWVVGDSIDVPLKIGTDKPESVGTDRLCCAAAAYDMEGAACTIADLGTAITVDCVDDQGRFIGGAILPGLALQASILAERTALLPRVTVQRPADPLGQDTEQAMRAGIFYGCVGAIKELAEQYASRLGRWPTLYVCGRDAAVVCAELEIADKVVPDLCLRGVTLAYLKSCGEERPNS